MPDLGTRSPLETRPYFSGGPKSIYTEAATKLDLMTLKPLIEALRQRGGGEQGEGGADLASRGFYQVREPTPVYMA